MDARASQMPPPPPCGDGLAVLQRNLQSRRRQGGRRQKAGQTGVLPGQTSQSRCSLPTCPRFHLDIIKRTWISENPISTLRRQQERDVHHRSDGRGREGSDGLGRRRDLRQLLHVHLALGPPGRRRDRGGPEPRPGQRTQVGLAAAAAAVAMGRKPPPLTAIVLPQAHVGRGPAQARRATLPEEPRLQEPSESAGRPQRHPAGVHRTAAQHCQSGEQEDPSGAQ